jgi:hypothetical protein
MYENLPVKACLNGEPTYEGMGGGKYGMGWWQGEEAWNQLMHGGTMGVIYGAAGLWQWKYTSDEPGWDEWANSSVSWREALDLEGARYVGFISKAFEGYDFTDMERRGDLTGDEHLLLAGEGRFYACYLERGGKIRIKNVPEGMSYVWFDPKAGTIGQQGKSTADGWFAAPDEKHWVLIVGEKQY